MHESRGEVTRLLGDLVSGDASALNKLIPLIYDELHALAAANVRGERTGHTLEPTALLHEAYMRLVDAKFSGFENRRQFFGLAATLMRRILVDYGRDRAACKRGGNKTVLTEAMAIPGAGNVDTLLLGMALDRLDEMDPDLCRVVELRFFGGLSVEEAAGFLDLSEPTVKRRWSAARAWLGRELRGQSQRASRA